MIFILNTKNNNGAKIALTAMGAFALGLVATGTTAMPTQLLTATTCK